MVVLCRSVSPYKHHLSTAMRRLHSFSLRSNLYKPHTEILHCRVLPLCNQISRISFKSCFCTGSLASSVNYPPEMDPRNNEIAHEFRFFKVYKNGRLEMFNPIHKIPPSDDPVTGVRSKDVVISSDPVISARIFLPKIHDLTQKLPVLYHIHGGGFCFESPCSPRYQNYLAVLAFESNAIVFSVEYGMFPARPIPACYEDSWVGLQWLANHVDGNGPDPWLNQHADFDRVFIGGDSAGGNISHDLAVRVGSSGLAGVNVVGIVLVHPYFGGTEDDKMWLFMCPNNSGLYDRRLKPGVEDLAGIGCGRVLVFLAGKDELKNVGQWYCAELKKSGWRGSVEIVENEGEGHCFHMDDLGKESSIALVKKIASFINQV